MGKQMSITGGFLVPIMRKGRKQYFSVVANNPNKTDSVLIGPNNGGLAVDDSEIMELNGKTVRVASNDLGTTSLIGKLAGKIGLENAFNKAFKVQEQYKDKKGIKDDGSRKGRVGLDEFLNQKRDSVITTAINNSFQRDMPEQQFYHTDNKQLLEKYKGYMKDAMLNINYAIEYPNPLFFRDSLSDYNYYKYLYDNKLEEGATCIKTATSNFGKQYINNSNINFMNSSGKNGFVEIPLNEIQKGDILQLGYFDTSSGEKIFEPHHAILYTGKDEFGIERGNQSKGGNQKDAYKKDTQLLIDREHPEKYKVYRFVGTQEDIDKWTQEYNNSNVQEKKYGGRIKAQPGTKTDNEIVEEAVKKASEERKEEHKPFDSGIKGFIPLIGDALSGLEAGYQGINGNYLNAGLVGAGLVVPNIAEKSLKYIGKVIKETPAGRMILTKAEEKGKQMLTKLITTVNKRPVTVVSDELAHNDFLTAIRRADFYHDTVTKQMAARQGILDEDLYNIQKQIPIDIKDTSRKDYLGLYTNETNNIKMTSNQSANEAKSTAIHEIRHSLDAAENVPTSQVHPIITLNKEGKIDLERAIHNRTGVKTKGKYYDNFAQERPINLTEEQHQLLDDIFIGGKKDAGKHSERITTNSELRGNMFNDYVDYVGEENANFDDFLKQYSFNLNSLNTDDLITLIEDTNVYGQEYAKNIRKLSAEDKKIWRERFIKAQLTVPAIGAVRVGTSLYNQNNNMETNNRTSFLYGGRKRCQIGGRIKADNGTFYYNPLTSKLNFTVPTFTRVNGTKSIISNNSNSKFSIPTSEKYYSTVSPNNGLGLTIASSAADLIGTLGSGIASLIAYNNMPLTPKPVDIQKAKLKTTYNINPALSETKNAVQQSINTLDFNTASSNTRNNTAQSIYSAGLANTTKLYADKENKETELINKDILQQHETDIRNAARQDVYNTQHQKEKLTQTLGITDTIGNMLSGSTEAFGNFATNTMKNNQFARNATIAAINNPNALSVLGDFKKADGTLDLNKLYSYFGGWGTSGFKCGGKRTFNKRR